MNRFIAGQRWRQWLLLGLCLIGAPIAMAEDDADFNVNSPALMAIRKSLGERHALLKEYFDAGAVGFTHEGLVAMREPGALVQEVRSRIELLVVEENKDLGTLYREIARANGRPDWESQFRQVFAERWISRTPAGWYYRDGNGNWLKKPAPGA